MSEPITLTVHELRALGRVLGLVLPAFVADDDPDDETLDLVALRGLMARGLIASDPPAAGEELPVADGLAQVLAPTREARVLAEVDEERDGAGPSTWAAVGDDVGPTTIVAEHRPGLVTIARSDDAVTSVVTDRCPLDDLVAEPEVGGFVVAAGTQLAADDAALDGDADGAVELLAAAGAPEDEARRWVEVVTGRRGSTAVQIARRLGAGDAGLFEASEVHWLTGTDGTAWMLTSEAAPLDDASDADALDPEHIDSLVSVVVAPIGRDDLRSVLHDTVARTRQES